MGIISFGNLYAWNYFLHLFLLKFTKIIFNYSL
jgi:hypothetical protein